MLYGAHGPSGSVELLDDGDPAAEDDDTELADTELADTELTDELDRLKQLVGLRLHAAPDNVVPAGNLKVVISTR